MKDLLGLTGMVIRASSVGDYDKRLVILTRERGKITAFARGAKRPGNSLMGPSRLFAFGVFKVFEGRETYSLQSAEISQYFEGLAADVERACYGQYFLEMADYYGREGLEGSAMLLLLYQSLRALLKPAIPNRLVQRVFELKMMVLNGEYYAKPPERVSDSAAYTWEYVVCSSVEKLYTFAVTPEVLEEFEKCVDVNKKRFIDREFHSLEILKTLSNSENRY